MLELKQSATDKVIPFLLVSSANETSVTTLVGLGAPGATALYKVYVVLTTANERGSNTVSVTRPG